MDHIFFMQRCMQLAEMGRGKVGLNPMVGAVLVYEDKIMAEGFHKGWGLKHAEIDLFEQKSYSKIQKIINKCILYVNLEPCSHFGKTPPCTSSIIRSGIKKVVCGIKDPNTAVNGILKLSEAGIDVIYPVLKEQCLRFNRGYISTQKKGRPWITLKSAQTKNGEFSNKDGSPLKITSKIQDEWSNDWLRLKHDAILVGVETIITDDPRLTIRTNSEQKMYSNYRIILDPNLRIPLDARVVQNPFTKKTIIVTKNAKQKYADILKERGVTVWEVPLKDGLFNFDELWKHCLHTTNDFYGISSILVEGGPTTWTAFRLAKCVDEEVNLVG